MNVKLCIRLPCDFAVNLNNCYIRQVCNVAAHVVVSRNSVFLLADMPILELAALVLSNAIDVRNSGIGLSGICMFGLVPKVALPKNWLPLKF